MSNETVFIKAIKFHIEYLKNIQQNINGAGDYCGTNHQSCTMGKWMHGEAADDVEKLGAEAENIFQQLFEPHEKFHEVSNTSIEAFNNNDHELAKSASMEMIFLSDKLTKLLLELHQIAVETQIKS